MMKWDSFQSGFGDVIHRPIMPDMLFPYPFAQVTENSAMSQNLGGSPVDAYFLGGALYNGSSIDEAKKAVEDRAKEFARAILGNTFRVVEIDPNTVGYQPDKMFFSELSPGPQSL